MNILPMALLMFSLPFGTALQSMAITVCALILLIKGGVNYRWFLTRIDRGEKRSIALLLSVALLQVIATLLNSNNPSQNVIPFLIGYLPIIVLPWLFILHQPLNATSIERLGRLWAWILAIWALVAISQNIWGWKLSGISLVTDNHFRRAQGFYSHPLTLAYVALMIWPLNLVRLCSSLRSKSCYVAVLGNLVLLYFSASRAAQAVAVLAALGVAVYYFKGRLRLIVMGLVMASVTAVFVTDNTVSRRFKAPPGQLSEDRESPYADDRIAFWLVHLNMVKERPVLGHGISLNREYRLPYYEAIGLPNFKKAYEAHNQLLQLAAEGGLGAALAFVAWMISVHRNFRDASPGIRLVRDLTLMGLFLGGLTQNAYFDAEVRFSLTCLLAFLLASRSFLFNSVQVASGTRK